MSKIIEALDEMQRLSDSGIESVAVAFSGGKDSLVCLDLCRRSFKKVVPYFMYMIPNLESTNIEIEYYEKTLGVSIKQYQHFNMANMINLGLYRWADEYLLPEVTREEMLNYIRHDTKCQMLANGGKLSDGMWRRRQMKKRYYQEYYLSPLKDYRKEDVLLHLHQRKIQQFKKGKVSFMNGATINQQYICMLHDEFPKDYERWLELFPLLPVFIAQRKFYGKTEAIKV